MLAKIFLEFLEVGTDAFKFSTKFEEFKFLEHNKKFLLCHILHKIYIYITIVQYH